MDNYFYIYNRHQANYFIKNGMLVLEFNKGKKDDYYVKFLRDDNGNKIFKQWIKIKENIDIN